MKKWGLMYHFLPHINYVILNQLMVKFLITTLKIMIFGNIRNFIETDVLNTYDVISVHKDSMLTMLILVA
jgi:hypothetical protein